METLGGEMYVKKATLEYHASARLDDTLAVGLRCARVGNSSSLFEAGIFSGEQLLVSGELVYVFADPATQTSRPVPPALRTIFESFEAGGEMAEVQTGDWNTLGRDAARLRTTVFVREQGIPAEIEADALDASARHAVAYNRLGMPVATGRLLQEAQGTVYTAPIAALAPGLALVLLVIGINSLADGLRDIADPIRRASR